MRIPGWWGLRSGGSTPIGVDFDRDRVHWVQLDRIKDSLTLRDACSIAHGGDLEALLYSKEDLKPLVREVLRKGHFRGRRIVTQAPSTDLRLMIVNYAVDAAKSVPQQIMDLARERMRDDLSDHVVDFVPIRTSGDQQGERSALVAVTLEDPVVEFLDTLRGAGLDVVALEIVPVAICRLSAAMSRSPGEEYGSEIALVLRISKATTELTLLSGRRLLLYREIEFGSESMVEAVTKGLDCDAVVAAELLSSFGLAGHLQDIAPTPEFPETLAELEDAGDIARILQEILRPSLRTLVEQTHKAISYATFQTHGKSIAKIDLIESASSCQGLDTLLAEMLQIPVEVFRPLSRVDGVDQIVSPDHQARLAVALGFALRGASR